MENFEKTFKFDTYSVIVRNTSLVYVFGNLSKMIPTEFVNTIDGEEIGRRIEINFTDRWGSSMRFIHYAPSDLKGMFDFIGKGYGMFDIVEEGVKRGKIDFIGTDNSIHNFDFGDCSELIPSEEQQEKWAKRRKALNDWYNDDKAERFRLEKRSFCEFLLLDRLKFNEIACEVEIAGTTRTFDVYRQTPYYELSLENIMDILYKADKQDMKTGEMIAVNVEMDVDQPKKTNGVINIIGIADIKTI